MRNVTVVVLVLDAVGVSTLEYLLDNYHKKPRFPNLSRLGLPRILDKRFTPLLGGDLGKSQACRLYQASESADSVIGHREMAGVIDPNGYELFPNGFPKKYISALEKKIGKKTIFNKMAGGMEAIELNAAEHEKTGYPIVYASKCDPLVQVAMNEAVIPVKEQHAIADSAFALAMEMRIPVTRAIARAYIKTPSGEIIRTSNRHDAVFPLKQKTIVDLLYSRNVWTTAVGKTGDLVNTVYHEKIKISDAGFLDPSLKLRFAHPKKKDTNPYSLQGTFNALIASKKLYRPNGTFIFANLVDTDSLYGHTKDINGAVKCIEETDRFLPLFEENMGRGDLLIITADHGMRHEPDYGYHSKEPLPLIAERIGFGVNMGGIKIQKDGNLTEVGRITAQAFGCEKEYVNLINPNVRKK